DVSARVTGTGHAVHRHQEPVATLTSALTASFEAGSRVTLGELGRRHAAARAGEVLVRDGARLARFRRRPDEDVAAFATRLAAGPDDGPATAEEAAGAALQLLVHADLPAPAGAQVYALYPAGIDAAAVHLLAAADLVAQLDPAGPPVSGSASAG
ncbi:MAG TPA: hypothetical protein VD813_13470, partial [Pseudonocardia sp.]|nr:hypothetical protein [Pseudonocardia sp.]